MCERKIVPPEKVERVRDAILDLSSSLVINMARSHEKYGYGVGSPSDTDWNPDSAMPRAKSVIGEQGNG